MVNHSLIEFIESYKNRNEEFKYNIFKVSITQRWKNELPRYRFGERDDYQTITLDEEDLKYLYDKYYPEYQKQIEERDRELIKEKQKEIKKLEEQLNKLKNDTIHSSKLQSL